MVKLRPPSTGSCSKSERRGDTFVPRKITIGLSCILRGQTDRLALGYVECVEEAFRLRSWNNFPAVPKRSIAPRI